jgi:hypothetical protein
MSKQDVIEVFGPQWVQDSLAFYRKAYEHAGEHVLALRTWLRTYDPSLPHPYDGGAWEEVMTARQPRKDNA